MAVNDVLNLKATLEESKRILSRIYDELVFYTDDGSYQQITRNFRMRIGLELLGTALDEVENMAEYADDECEV